MIEDEIDRLKLCIKLADISQAKIGEACEIDKDRLSKALTKKIRLSSAEIIRLANYFHEHRHWIVFGEELPEAGQVSPMTKIAQRDYRQTDGG